MTSSVSRISWPWTIAKCVGFWRMASYSGEGELDDRRETRFWVVGKLDDTADVARATDPRS